MATTTKKLQNFIAGKSVPTSGDDSHEVRNAASGEVIAEMGSSATADIDAAVAAATNAFAEWKEATPSERSLALLRIADEIEQRGEELARIESENTGKPLALTIGEEIPAGGGSDPFLRQRRPYARGPRERRVHGRAHVDHPPRADRRLRPDHAVELPVHDGDLEVRPGARRRQHRRPQALGEHPHLHALAGRADAEAPAPGSVQRSAGQG